MHEPLPIGSGTVVITGGTVGLGYEAALAIAKEHPEYNIILASRTDPNNATQSITKATGCKSISFQPLDLSSLQNVRDFANALVAKKPSPIEILLLNAGIQLNAGIKYTIDGYEQTFAVNHLGHALLLFLLRPHLADDCRIIFTSSGTHDPARKTMVPDALYTSAEELAHPPPAQVKNYDGRQMYATSKLLNVLFTYALQRRLPPHQTTAAFDPGLMPGTGLARDAPAFQQFLWLRVLPHLLPLLRWVLSPNIHSPRESGMALARLAMGKGEGYWEGGKEVKSSGASYDREAQEELWGWTVRALEGEGVRGGFEGGGLGEGGK